MTLRWRQISWLFSTTGRLVYTDIKRYGNNPSLIQNIRSACCTAIPSEHARQTNRNTNRKCLLLQSNLSYQVWASTRWASSSAGTVTVDSPPVTRYLEARVARYQHAQEVLLRSQSGRERSEASKTVQETRRLVQLYQEYRTRLADRHELNAIITANEDAEMVQMAQQEIEQLDEFITEQEAMILEQLVPEERVDHNDVVFELTAGVGGAEAMLFAEEIFTMYTNFITYMGWSHEIVQYDANESGGMRHASMAVSGQEVYGWLKFEGGVHRVQRVPRTEKSGRIHTSTATVSVMPQPTEIEIQIDKKDLKIDVFRASGAGGQHVNKTESAVRLTHIPSGLVVECQVGRSQLKNKETALKVLRSRLYERELEKQQSKFRSQKKVQVGTASRSEKIRTYNYNQDRITDHRLSGNRHNIDDFMSGGEALSELLTELLDETRAERLVEALEHFQQEAERS